MISLAAITLGGGAVYVGLQWYDRARGVKRKPLYTVLQNTPGSDVETASEDESHRDISLSTNYHIAGVDLDRTTAIVTLTATTAIVHIALARPLMILNGIGSVVLLIPHYFVPALDAYRNHTRDILIAYTVVTFAGFYIVKDVASWFSPIGIVCKLVELGLLTLLWHERTDHTRLLDELVKTMPATEQAQPAA
ncbi:MAG: hypothetical protein AAF702_18795 [Chloroflexota bacterium]